MKFSLFLLLTVGMVCCDNVLQEFSKGNSEFSASLYQKLMKDNPGNLIVSPLSVQIVLALIQLGAKGETALELSKGLHLPESPEKIKETFKDLLPEFRGNEFFSLNSANRIYLSDSLKLNAEFQKQSEEIFDAGLESINFSEVVKASEAINKWVESKTNDKIKNLVAPEILGPLTTMILVNALYFKGNWSSPFDTFATQKRKFFKSEKEEIEVDTMQQIETFRYADNKDLDVQFLEIPYLGSNVTFTIILPNKKEGLSALEGRLSEVFLPQNYTYERVSLFMPKFKVESKFNLIPPLIELGIKKAFSPEADFSELLAAKQPLSISDVIQKAFIEVTESGTEAAAATLVQVDRIGIDGQLKSPINFMVDRPFAYSIKLHDVILFTGRLLTPMNEEKQ